MSISKIHSMPFKADEEKNKTEPSTLYLVATPIGNLGDISMRAYKVLSEVDFVAAEDTRNSGRLLSYLEIKKPLISYHDHNIHAQGIKIADRLTAGESCALITDAGMPAISDPGADIVEICAARGIRVSCVPGPCAAVTALVLSALPAGRFAFEGFLSTANKPRKERLAECAKEKRTMIFYEAPHKLKKTLEDFGHAFGTDRRISLCRELTKINEEIIRTDIAGAQKMYENTEPRGEYVLVVEGYDPEFDDTLDPLDRMSIEERVEMHIAEGNSRMDAIKLTAKELGVGKRDVYDALNRE